MQRKIHFWCLCGIVALALLAPGIVGAEENAVGDLMGEKTRSGLAEANLKAPKAEANDEAAAVKAAEEEQKIELEGEEQPISLEELESLFGKAAVCGVPCGQPGQTSCRIRCGDAASCFHGRCIYL